MLLLKLELYILPFTLLQETAPPLRLALLKVKVESFIVPLAPTQRTPAPALAALLVKVEPVKIELPAFTVQ